MAMSVLLIVPPRRQPMLRLLATVQPAMRRATRRQVAQQAASAAYSATVQAPNPRRPQRKTRVMSKRRYSGHRCQARETEQRSATQTSRSRAARVSVSKR